MHWCSVLWIFAVSTAGGSVLRLTPSFFPVAFTSSGAVTDFPGTGLQLFAATYETNYGFSAWLWVADTTLGLPKTPILVLSTAGTVKLRVSVLPGGTIEAGAATYGSAVELTATSSDALQAGKWMLVAACSCAAPGQLEVLTAYYGQIGTTITPVAAVLKLMEYDRVESLIRLGGTDNSGVMDGKLMSVQAYFGICLNSQSLQSQLSECYGACGTCTSPLFSACSDLAQLIAPQSVDATNRQSLSYPLTSPPLSGKSFGQLDMTFLGWYYNTDSITAQLNLFKAENTYCDNDIEAYHGCKVMSLYLNNLSATLTSPVYTLGSVNKPTNTVPVTFEATPEWMFYAVSHCYDASASPPAVSVVTYYAHWGDSSLTKTDSGPMTDLTLPLGIDPSTSSIYIGDPVKKGIVGELTDVRYYPAKCVSESDLTAIFLEKKAKCMLGCSACSEPTKCTACSDGYYGPSADACLPCNSCCATCNGSTNNDCLTCSSTCYRIGASTLCIRKGYTACYSTCDTCSSTLQTNCLTCSAGNFMQAGSNGICSPLCPTGYRPNIDKCTGAPSLVLDLQFDAMQSWFLDKTQTTLALMGATEQFYPPAYEPSDPIPVKQRGFHFSGGQYVQLPPHPRSLEYAPFVFAQTLTVETWIRAEANGNTLPVFAKTCGSPLFVLRLDPLGNVEFEGGWPPAKLAVSDPPHALGPNWTRVVVSMTVDSLTAKSTVNFYINDLPVVSLTDALLMLDTDVTCVQLIGAEWNVDPLQWKYFSGFIWNFKIWNSARDAASIATDYSATTNPVASGLISACAFNAEAQSCGACTGCLYGCVRTTDCSKCRNLMCDVCQDFENMECLVCTANAVLGPYKLCECLPGSYFVATSRTCEACSVECKKCTDSAAGHCTDCYSGAELLAPSKCTCSSGYFPNPDPRSCVRCHRTCRECSGAGAAACTSCYEGAQLSAESCSCSAGFYPSPDPSNCLHCADRCLKCTSTICTKCQSGLYMQAQFCVSACSKNYELNSDTLTCVYLPPSQIPLTASLNVTSASAFTIKFSEALVVTLLSTDIGLILVDVDGFEYTIKWDIQSSSLSQVYVISMKIAEPYLPPENEFTVYFINPGRLVDQYDNSLATSQLSSSLPGFGTLPGSGSSVDPAQSSSVRVASSSIVSGLLLSLISGNPGTMWSMLNSMAVLSYCPLLSVNTTDNLNAFLGSLNMQSFVPNPFKYMIDNSTIKSQQSPDYISNAGIDSTLFLLNAGVMFSVGVALLTYWPFIQVMTRFPVKIVAMYYQKAAMEFRWNALLRYWIQIYMDVCLAAFIQVRNVLPTQVSFTCALTAVNSLLAFFFSLAFCLTPVLVLRAVISNSQVSPATNAVSYAPSFQTLFKEFKSDCGRKCVMYYPLFFLYRLIVCASFTLLHEVPVVQAVLCILSSAAVGVTQMTVYLLVYRPFVKTMDQFATCISETGMLGVFMLLSIFTRELDSTSKDFYSTAVIALVFFVVGMMCAVSFIRMLKSISEIIAEYLAARRKTTKVSLALRSIRISRPQGAKSKAQVEHKSGRGFPSDLTESNKI